MTSPCRRCLYPMGGVLPRCCGATAPVTASPQAPLVRGNFAKAPSLNFSAVENFPRSLRPGPLDTYRRGVETSLHAQPVQRRQAPGCLCRKTTSDRITWRNAMCDNRLRAPYLKELMAEVRAMLGEWWRQRGSTASIPGFQSVLDTPTGEDGPSTVDNTP